MPHRPPSFRPLRLKSYKKDEDRPTAAQQGYCSKSHKSWRKAVLARDGWQCQSCGRICTASDPKTRAHADHIKPIAEGGDRYDLTNGQCLCASCHSIKTARENDFGRRGRSEAR